jgi:hypothetical protein
MLPLLAGTNGANVNLGAFDAPSLRGIYDRFALNRLSGNTSHETLEFFNDPVGRLQPPFQNTPPSEFPFDFDLGYSEDSAFAAGFMFFRVVYRTGPVDIFQMLGEASTGTSGATGRQVTLNTAAFAEDRAPRTRALLDALEHADATGAVELAGDLTRVRRGWGRFLRARRDIAYDAEAEAYAIGDRLVDREELVDWVVRGEAVATLTARLPDQFALGIHRQPLLAIAKDVRGATGDPGLPFGSRFDPRPTIQAKGIDVRAGAAIFLDGERVDGEVHCVDGTFTSEFCSSELVDIELFAPIDRGLHLIQVQNPQGPFSNELPICIDSVAYCR